MVSTTAKQITPWTKSSEKEWEKEDESFKSVCKLCIIRACNAQRSHKFRGFNRKAYSWHLTFVKLIIIPGVKMKRKKQWINNWEDKNVSSFPFALFQLFSTVSRPIQGFTSAVVLKIKSGQHFSSAFDCKIKTVELILQVQMAKTGILNLRCFHFQHSVLHLPQISVL